MTMYSDGAPSSSVRSMRRSDGSGTRRSLSRANIESILESDRRREVVRTVAEATEPVAVRTLVARLAAAEHDATAVTTLLERRQRVYVSLRQTHLPLLETSGVVVYDRDRSLVGSGESFRMVEATLDGAGHDPSPRVRP